MVQLLGTVLIAVSAVLAVAICVLYHRSARWWESEAGRHVMSFTGVIALVLWLWLIGALTQTQDRPWWDVVRLVAFTGVPWVLGWRLWLLYKLQIRPRRQRKETR